MGLLSGLWGWLTKPVMDLGITVNSIADSATNFVDDTVETVLSPFSGIPIIGNITDEIVFQVDNLTDIVDTTLDWENQTVDTVLIGVGGVLDLDGETIHDMAEIAVGGTVDTIETIFDQLGDSVESLFTI